MLELYLFIYGYYSITFVYDRELEKETRETHFELNFLELRKQSEWIVSLKNVRETKGEKQDKNTGNGTRMRNTNEREIKKCNVKEKR